MNLFKKSNLRLLSMSLPMCALRRLVSGGVRPLALLGRIGDHRGVLPRFSDGRDGWPANLILRLDALGDPEVDLAAARPPSRERVLAGRGHLLKLEARRVDEAAHVYELLRRVVLQA